MVTKMRMRAVFDCSADEPGELSFKEGDILTDVVESGEEGWYSGRIENSTERGLFPYNYVERISESLESTPELNDTEKKKNPETMTTIPIVTSNITNITIPTSTIKSACSTGNKTSQAHSANDKTSLPGFPALDAFEAAMSAGKGSKVTSTISSSWTPLTTASNSITSSPPVISPKPKLPTVSTNVKKDVGNTGLGIKIIGPAISEKPQLKSISLQQEASPTRLRSYSTSSVLNMAEKEPTAEKTLRPSQLLNGKGTKSALELALSKGSPSGRPQSNLRSNSFSKQNNPGGNIGGGVALVGMTDIKLNSSTSNDVEDEDGYQMVKPSQLRQRQQQTSSPKPITSKSSGSSFTKSSVTTTPSWKKSSENSFLATSNKLNNSNSPKSSTSSKLEDVPVSSNPMPRLPSRPVSTASRRSRNSRTSSINASPTTSTSTTPAINKASLPPVKETHNEKAAPPILKPKPQIAQPNLPPRPSNKLRSTSNPPPIQPKPAMSSIEILISKNAATAAAASDKKSSSPTSSIESNKATTPPRIIATKPSIYQQKQQTNNKSTFVPLPGMAKPNSIPTRPSLDSWRSVDTTDSADVNLKPSALLNRARSATNPTSNTKVDWSSIMTKPSSNKSSSVPRPISPIAHPVSRPVVTAEPMALVETKPVEKKKATPPPPPPSRPPKSSNLNNSNKGLYLMDEASKHRYEILFDTIHDDGYVDGETARFIWLKSKLSSDELAHVWKECDPDHKGLLDKHAFIDGMGRIDELLLNKQQQVV